MTQFQNPADCEIGDFLLHTDAPADWNENHFAQRFVPAAPVEPEFGDPKYEIAATVDPFIFHRFGYRDDGGKLLTAWKRGR